MKRLHLPFRRKATPPSRRIGFSHRRVPTGFFDLTLEQQLEWARTFLDGIAPVPPGSQPAPHRPSPASTPCSPEKGTP